LALALVREIPLELFRTNLSNRKQFVKVENVQSGLVDISNGVPQGIYRVH